MGELPIHVLLNGLSMRTRKCLLVLYKAYPESIYITDNKDETIYDKLFKSLNRFRTPESVHNRIVELLMRTLLRIDPSFNRNLYCELNYKARRLCMFVAFNTSINIYTNLRQHEQGLFQEVLTYL